MVHPIKRFVRKRRSSENVASENVASENVASENVASENVASENVACPISSQLPYLKYHTGIYYVTRRVVQKSQNPLEAFKLWIGTIDIIDNSHRYSYNVIP